MVAQEIGAEKETLVLCSRGLCLWQRLVFVPLIGHLSTLLITPRQTLISDRGGPSSLQVLRLQVDYNDRKPK
jgi:hypothetical protein